MLRTRIQANSSGFAAIVITAEPAAFQSPKAASGIARSTSRMKQNTAISNKDNIRAEEKVESKDILRILENQKGWGGLISILEEIQAQYGYLPEESLGIVSQRTGRSLVDIYGVATFYRFFSLQPKGKHLVCAGLGTACHVRGAPRIVAELQHQLGIKAGQTTPDKEFTLETVNCLGACALGPVVVIDGHYFSKVRKSKVKQLLEQGREGFDKVDIGKDERIFPIDVSSLILLFLVLFVIYSFVLLALSDTPGRRILYESHQPKNIKYDSFAPYILRVVTGRIQWNTLGWPRSCIIEATRSENTSYGHFIEIDLNYYVRDGEGIVAIWTENGIEVSFSLGHKLTIPKRVFLGGR